MTTMQSALRTVLSRMGNDEHRPPFHQGIHTLLNVLLGPGIDRRGCLVQYHHLEDLNGGSGNGQKLALAWLRLAPSPVTTVW